MNIKGAIFDLDGTLLESLTVWDHVGEIFLEQKGIEPEPGLNKILKPLSLMQAAQYFRRRYAISDSEEQILSQVDSIMTDQYTCFIPLKKGARDCIRRMESRGVKLCAATATSRLLAESALRRLEILDCFDFILTCTECGAGKDEATIYEEALSRLGTERENTVVFEDSYYAIKTAKRAGFYVVAVQENHSLNDADRISRTADEFIQSLDHVQID